LKVLSLAVIAGALVFISLPSEGETGKSLSEADLKKIDDITQAAMNSALARDFTTWAALFLDDAVVNPPNEPAVKGRAAIRAWLEKFPAMTEFKLNNEKVEGTEDLGYVLGTYSMTITPPKGRPGQSRTPANLLQSCAGSQMAAGFVPWICSAQTCHLHHRRLQSRRAFKNIKGKHCEATDASHLRRIKSGANFTKVVIAFALVAQLLNHA
jgi:ketosteroid isomerase-like protein